MRNDTLIRESLLYKNRDNYEQSECVRCEVGRDFRGCDWMDMNGSVAPDAGMPLYFSEDGKALFTDFTHSTIIGSTGTGKSEVIVKNYLQIFALVNDERKPSFLASDLKGDISLELKGYLEKHGYNVVIMDMKRPYQSKRYNFMTQIYDDYQEAYRIKCQIKAGEITTEFGGRKFRTLSEAKCAANAKVLTLMDRVERAIVELSNIIIVCTDPEDASWFSGARTMFCAIVLTMLHDSENPKNGMTREKFTIANVCRAAFTTEDDCETIIGWLKRAEDHLTVQNAIMGNYNLRAKVTRDGYVSTLNTALSAYTTNAVGALTATSDDINLKEIATRDKPYAIFLITDDQQKITNSIAMMLINNLVAELTEHADNVGPRNLSRDFVFLLDEFANMPPMPGMSNKITTLRSRRVWMMMAVQSIQQLRQVYGEDTSDIIRDNCDTSIFLGSNNLNTKQIFSESMGQKIGIFTSYNKGNDGNTSESITASNTAVVRISDLDELKLGEFYVRSRVAGNMKSYMIPFFKRTELKIVRDDREDRYRAFDPKSDMYKIGDVLKREEQESGRSRKFNFDF
ncbi:MAG: type IV secretory system conjugative DNA transfer family protein [Clostridia bacterium]|nr:type IV secretory system conjugative DNA transfer family protein [Clostridia bacterium]